MKTTLIILSILSLNLQANTLSVNAGFTTDYVARGTSQTLGDSAFQFGADYNFDNGFYLGAWTSNVNFNDGTDQEIDGWIGYRKTIDKVTIDSSLNLYGYVNDPVPYEMVEAKFIFSETVNKWNFSQTVAYSPDYFNILDQSVWVEMAAAYNFTEKLSISGGVGYQYIQGGGSYGCYNIGVSYKLTKNFTLDGHFYDTNDHGQGEAWENRVSFSLKAVF